MVISLMNVLISGHRKSKLSQYSEIYIKMAIEMCIDDIILKCGYVIGLSGMADGVDLWFCQLCLEKDISYKCYIPFENQDNYMSTEDVKLRDYLIQNCKNIKYSRNSQMVEDCNSGIVVWDGNKGGTHNVFQQLIENQKDFYWINPVKECIVCC